MTVQPLHCLVRHHAATLQFCSRILERVIVLAALYRSPFQSSISQSSFDHIHHHPGTVGYGTSPPGMLRAFPIDPILPSVFGRIFRIYRQRTLRTYYDQEHAKQRWECIPNASIDKYLSTIWFFIWRNIDGPANESSCNQAIFAAQSRSACNFTESSIADLSAYLFQDSTSKPFFRTVVPNCGQQSSCARGH